MLQYFSSHFLSTHFGRSFYSSPMPLPISERSSSLLTSSSQKITTILALPPAGTIDNWILLPEGTLPLQTYFNSSVWADYIERFVNSVDASKLRVPLVGLAVLFRTNFLNRNVLSVFLRDVETLLLGSTQHSQDLFVPVCLQRRNNQCVWWRF